MKHCNENHKGIGEGEAFNFLSELDAFEYDCFIKL